MPSATQRAAEADADQLLTTVWRIGQHLPLPVDPVAIARRLGIEVLVSEMTPSVSGALITRPDAAPVIHLSRGDGRVRQRFTCAHEIGHYRRAIRRGETSYERVDRRDQLSSRGTDVEEVFANTFAAALLMPREALAGAEERHPVDLAYSLEVSAEAMTHRLANLKLAAS